MYIYEITFSWSEEDKTLTHVFAWDKKEERIVQTEEIELENPILI